MQHSQSTKNVGVHQYILYDKLYQWQAPCWNVSCVYTVNGKKKDVMPKHCTVQLNTC